MGGIEEVSQEVQRCLEGGKKETLRERRIRRCREKEEDGSRKGIKRGGR